MDWYRVIKTIKGRGYFYDQKTYRRGMRVSTINKYVGPAGKPMYHGTLAQFDHFDLKFAGSNTRWDNARFGIFFLDDVERAKTFVEATRPQGDERSVQVKEAYLSIKNPLDLTLHGIFTKADQAPTIAEITGGDKGMSPQEALEFLNENIGLGEIDDFREALYAHPDNKKIIQDAGYDGIVSTFGHDDTGNIIKEYVVFDLSQIKIKATRMQ